MNQLICCCKIGQLYPTYPLYFVFIGKLTLILLSRFQIKSMSQIVADYMLLADLKLKPNALGSSGTSNINTLL